MKLLTKASSSLNSAGKSLHKDVISNINQSLNLDQPKKKTKKKKYSTRSGRNCFRGYHRKLPKKYYLVKKTYVTIQAERKYRPTQLFSMFHGKT